MIVSRPPRLLLVDDDLTFRLSTAELLRQDGYEVILAADGREAAAAVRDEAFDLILLDLRMPGADGISLIEELRRWGASIPILMITGFGSIESAVKALKLGADDFLTKPLDPEVLTSRVAELLDRRPTARTVKEEALRGIVGRSPVMQSVFEAIRTVAQTETTVLVIGETGTGKELAARAIHDLSHRSEGPFVPVNCSSMTETLLESELFGHVRGAFTGAVSDKHGLFEVAKGGTVFLDEIGDTTLSLQQRLLRVLQEREVMRVGSVRPVAVDVRIIAATHRDLRDEITAGRFRDDLFYRLNVFRIELPPLRQRAGDVPLLVETALERLRRAHAQFANLSCSPLAMRLLRAYHWPGNVRELFAAVESSAVRAGGSRIEAQHLPQELRCAVEYRAGEGGPRYRPTAKPQDECEAVRAALEEADGVRARAAELLGMSRTTLWRKMKQYGLDEEGEDVP
jgi:DNA-binding NtrC family response regulator